MEKIKRFFECLLPVTVCNLECSYCYVIQENRRSMEMAQLKYSPEHIAKALRKERVGGTCLISICGAGETLAQNEAVPIVKYILQEGHFVNITTNGTLTNRFDQLIEECGENINRLHISFSLHYIELKKRGWLERFFKNICKMRAAGASILLQINLCDEYIPYIEEIKEISYKYVGAYPQVALTRDESEKPFKVMTGGSYERYLQQGSRFESPLFRFTTQNFNMPRKEFCYAGEWSGVLNLQTGWLSRCYANPEGENIFENIKRPIHFEAVGKYCHNSYCVNSSHFMSLGVIPELDTPTYAELRNREEAHWYSEEMREFLNHKLSESNRKYGVLRKNRMLWKTAWLSSSNEKNRLKSTVKMVIEELIDE